MKYKGIYAHKSEMLYQKKKIKIKRLCWYGLGYMFL